MSILKQKMNNKEVVSKTPSTNKAPTNQSGLYAILQLIKADRKETKETTMSAIYHNAQPTSSEESEEEDAWQDYLKGNYQSLEAMLAWDANNCQGTVDDYETPEFLAERQRKRDEFQQSNPS